MSVRGFVVVSPWVVVGPSSISGLGAFASTRVPKDTLLGTYEGEHLTAAELARRYPPASSAPPQYVFQRARDHFIDARDPKRSNWTRYINSPHGVAGRRPNARFTARGSIRTTRALEPGEEILIHYGPAYRFSCTSCSSC